MRTLQMSLLPTLSRYLVCDSIPPEVESLTGQVSVAYQARMSDESFISAAGEKYGALSGENRSVLDVCLPDLEAMIIPKVSSSVAYPHVVVT